MRVAITGGRDHEPTPEELNKFWWLWSSLGGSELLHGDCPTGVDAWLDYLADNRRIPKRTFPPDWKRHGRAAGPIRNGEMVAAASALIAFPGGRGTADCVRQAKARGIGVYFVSEEEKL